MLGKDETYGGPWESSIEEPTRSKLVTEKEPRIQTTRFPQVPSTAEYPNIINVVPMGNPQVQPGLKTTEEDNPEAYAKKMKGEYRVPLTAFEQELRRLINRFSMESHSNTPDNILAEYLCSCLSAFNYAIRAREKWYGRRVF